MSHRLITRRNFIRTTTYAAALMSAKSFPLFANQGLSKSRVVLIRNQTVLNKDGVIDRHILENMLDDAVMNLFDLKSAGDCWKKIVKPDDIVGIKTNAWRYLPTPTEMESILKARLQESGVGESNISTDDRGVLNNPIFKKATVLINTRPMRAHHWSGVGGCLKNYIMFTPKPSDLHPDSCVDLGSVWNLPMVKGKTRLNVLVMLTPQFHCMGPHHFDKEYVWQYKGLLVGADPVAVDAVGLTIFEAKRKLYFKEDSPIRPLPKHVKAAEEKHGVGIANLNKIELIKLGWKDEILI